MNYHKREALSPESAVAAARLCLPKTKLISGRFPCRFSCKDDANIIWSCYHHQNSVLVMSVKQKGSTFLFVFLDVVTGEVRGLFRSPGRLQ